MSNNSSDEEGFRFDGIILADESSPNKYTWVINNFFEAYRQGDVLLQSGLLPWGDGRCYLVLENLSHRGLDLLILSMSFEHDSMDPVHWKLGIKRHDGSLIKSAEGIRRFEMEDDGFIYNALGIRVSEICKEDVSPEEDVLKVMIELRPERHEGSTDASSQTNQIWRCSTLGQNLKALLLNGEGSDVTIRVKGQNFQIHRAIMQARSPVFSAMLRHEMSEKVTGIVDIEDCEPDTFLVFLHYVYAGTVEDVSPNDATSLYEVANKYQVEELKSVCLAIIQEGLSVDSFCKIVTLAHMHEKIALLNIATDFFSNNLKEIIVTLDWQNFIRVNPIEANELFIKAIGAERPRRNYSPDTLVSSQPLGVEAEPK